MSSKFHHSLHRQGDISWVKLSGVIDEDNELASLAEAVGGRTAVVDLGGVERINSCGVRDWVRWLGELEARRIRVVLIRCSPAIVAQINLVNNFLGAAVVKSFHAPYFCPQCDAEKVLACEVEDFGDPPHEPPRCRCDDCDQVMEFDDLAESYFAFLAEPPDRELLAELGGVVEKVTVPEESSRLRTRGSSSHRSPLPSIPSLPSDTAVGKDPFPDPPPPRATEAPAPAPKEPAKTAAVYWVIAGLLAAIALVAYLLLR